MIKNVYVAYDKVATSVLCVFCAPNDGLAIRENVVALSKVLPLGDIELRCVGSVDDESSLLTSNNNYRIIDWNSYKFPESPIRKSDVEVGTKNERRIESSAGNVD